MGAAKPVDRGKALNPAAPGAAPPAPYGLPWDSAYESSLGSARARYNNALIGLGYNRTALQQDYGLDQGFNDYKTNPYSRAAELQRSFERSNRSSQTSMGSAGHLYSGSLQNQLGYNRSARDTDYNSLRSSYQQALQDIRNRELGAADEMNDSVADAAWRRVETAERQPLDPSIAPGGGRKAKPKQHKPRVAVGRARKAR